MSKSNKLTVRCEAIAELKQLLNLDETAKDLLTQPAYFDPMVKVFLDISSDKKSMDPPKKVGSEPSDNWWLAYLLSDLLGNSVGGSDVRQDKAGKNLLLLPRLLSLGAHFPDNQLGDSCVSSAYKLCARSPTNCCQLFPGGIASLADVFDRQFLKPLLVLPDPYGVPLPPGQEPRLGWAFALNTLAISIICPAFKLSPVALEKDNAERERLYGIFQTLANFLPTATAVSA